jgi:hypothetical protein
MPAKGSPKAAHPPCRPETLRATSQVRNRPRGAVPADQSLGTQPLPGMNSRLPEEEEAHPATARRLARSNSNTIFDMAAI